MSGHSSAHGVNECLRLHAVVPKRCMLCAAWDGVASLLGLREFFLMLRKADLLDTIISSVKALQVRSGPVPAV
jgi:hypothetical protein